jgi:RNA polymerase sigma-70 factor (ECF subfamily)
MQQQFEQIIAEHNGILYKIGRAYTNNTDDFDDLYQDMLVQVWQALPSFKQASKLSTWLYRVCLNTALLYQRRDRKQVKTASNQEVLNQLPDDSAQSLQQVQEREHKIELLYACIYELPRLDRAIILLHLEKKKYEEIAHIVGLQANHIGVKACPPTTAPHDCLGVVVRRCFGAGSVFLL